MERYVKYNSYQIDTILEILHKYPNIPKRFKINKINKNKITFDEFVQFWFRYINKSPEIIPYYMGRVSFDPIKNSLESLTEQEKEVIISNCGCIVLCNFKIDTKYRMNLYLDKKTFGYSNQKWGSSNKESILLYAKNRNLPITGMLERLIKDFYE